MERLFCTTERSEDLLQWTRNLQALGRIVEDQGFHEDKDEILMCHGQQIGRMISDYANAAHQTAHEAYEVITEFFKDDDGSSLHILEKRLKRLQKKPAIVARFDLEQLDELYKEFKLVFDRVMHINSAFWPLKEELTKKVNMQETERALTEAKNEARAQDTDHEGPNTEIKLTQVKS
jgi:hypothetical protein